MHLLTRQRFLSRYKVMSIYMVQRDMQALLTASNKPAIKPVLAIAFGKVSMICPSCSNQLCSFSAKCHSLPGAWASCLCDINRHQYRVNTQWGVTCDCGMGKLSL